MTTDTMYRTRAPRRTRPLPAVTHQSLSTSPIGVRLTDSVLAAVDTRLAAPDPEQGGALLRPLNGSAVTHFEWDATAATTGISYVPSDDLVERVAALETTEDLSLVGVIHSHPNGMNRLSGPDLEVTRHLLQLNRHLGWVCMPIVTQTDGALPLARHEVALPHGRISFFLARLDRTDDLHIAAPASVRVLPVERIGDVVARLLGWTADGHQHLTIHGTSMVGCRFHPAGDDRTVWVLLSHDFPLAAPLIAVEDGDGFTPRRLATVADADADVAISALIGALDLVASIDLTDAIDPIDPTNPTDDAIPPTRPAETATIPATPTTNRADPAVRPADLLEEH